MKLKLLVTLATLLICQNSVAEENIKHIKDYGVKGHVFEIKEESMLDMIKDRLAKAESSGVLRPDTKDRARSGKVEQLKLENS